VFQARSHAQKCAPAPAARQRPPCRFRLTARRATPARYFSKVHKNGTGEYVPTPRPKRKSAAQMEKERAMAKQKKPEKERHWYSLYQNLDPSQVKRHSHAQYAVIPTREKLPAPPPGTPNYSGRPEGKPAPAPEHSSSTVRNGYGSPTRPVSLAPMLQAAAAAAHNAAVSHHADTRRAALARQPGGAASPGAPLRLPHESPASAAPLPAHAAPGSRIDVPQLQPSSFGADVHGLGARKRKELTADDFHTRLHAAGIQVQTPHLFKSVMNAVDPHGQYNTGCDRGVECAETLAMPQPHRDLSTPALEFLPRQRDLAGVSAQMEISCFPNRRVVQRDRTVAVSSETKCTHAALLEAQEELRLRCLAVAFADACDKSAFDRMNEPNARRKPVPFPRWGKPIPEAPLLLPSPGRPAPRDPRRLLPAEFKQGVETEAPLRVARANGQRDGLVHPLGGRAMGTAAASPPPAKRPRADSA